MSSSAPISSPPPPEIILEADRASAHYWRDLWRYR